MLPSGGISQEEMLVDSDFKGKIRELVEKYKLTADEKERAIIDLRLLTDEPLTLQEIADRFGISRERIRQIETRLKDRLKNMLSGGLDLDDFGHVEAGGLGSKEN